jgi:SAM-dependent methyltransferase
MRAMASSSNERFVRLIADAQAYAFSGWDFSKLSNRWREDALTRWDYRAIIQKHLHPVTSLLDMGTGGGEFLSSLKPRPARVIATECYAPNIPVARGRLEPLGIEVRAVKDDDQLPFNDATFDMVINRHSSLDASEVRRVLKPGGLFITQQVGDQNNMALNSRLGDVKATHSSPWSAPVLAKHLIAVGFTILRQAEEFPATHFFDIGAVVIYLHIIPWQIPGFTVEKFREPLRSLHEEIEANGDFRCLAHRFLVVARNTQ